MEFQVENVWNEWERSEKHTQAAFERKLETIEQDGIVLNRSRPYLLLIFGLNISTISHRFHVFLPFFPARLSSDFLFLLSNFHLFTHFIWINFSF